MPPVFTRYQKFVVAVLAFLQFTIILDFMIISPLGALLLRDLHITTRQFGLAVSAYAFSAGASGLLAAGFADKFDRKRLLLFFYAGFLLGTFLCGVANSYHFLLVARIVTGVFGGVIGSIVMARQGGPKARKSRGDSVNGRELIGETSACSSYPPTPSLACQGPLVEFPPAHSG